MTKTLTHQNRNYEDQSIYVVGNSFANCTFRRCTLVLKDLAAVAHFQNCHFESCVWHLQVTVSERRVWEHFLAHDAGFLTGALPPADVGRADSPEADARGGGISGNVVRPGPARR